MKLVIGEYVYKLNKDQWSFSQQATLPAGTAVAITKRGKRDAGDRAQVSDRDGNRAVVFLKDLAEVSA